MKLRSVLLLLLFIAIAAFVAINWNQFTEPTTLSLGFATIQAPLGLIMLGLVALLTFVFLAFAAALQVTLLRESRQHARELHSHRELADQAEASRFTELRNYLERELNTLEASHAESRAAVLARIDQLDEAIRKAQEQSSNTVAAYIGELDDRLDRSIQNEPRLPIADRRDH